VGVRVIARGLSVVLASRVAHGPFSHLCESCLGIDHEVWSKAVLLSEETQVHQTLKRHFDHTFPRRVAELKGPVLKGKKKINQYITDIETEVRTNAAKNGV
jgi:uncharacterized protein